MLTKGTVDFQLIGTTCFIEDCDHSAICRMMETEERFDAAVTNQGGM